MAQKNPFLKYIMKDKKEDVFHSSAYAKAQNGTGFGATSSESFKVRVNINQHRQAVRGYSESKLMTEGVHGGPKAKTYEAPDASGARTPHKIGMVGRASTGTTNAGSKVTRPVFKPNFSVKK